MTRLATAFREDVSKELFEIYYEFLGNVEIAKLKECVDILIEEKNWFPKISEFNEILHPKSNPDSAYMRYLERSTKQHLSEIKQLELKREQEREVPEEVKERINKIFDTIERDLRNPVLEGERAEEFERKRKIAKQKTKELLNSYDRKTQTPQTAFRAHRERDQKIDPSVS